MKKLLLILLLTTSYKLVSAQSASMGLKGGLNFATLQGSGVENNTVAGTNSVAGSAGITSVNFGVFVDIKIGRFSLQPGISFTGKGGRFNGYSGTLPNGSISSLAYKYTLNYIQVPVNLVYHIPVTVGEIYIGAGPYVSTGLSGKRHATADNNDNGAHTFFGSIDNIKFGDEAGDIKPTDIGAVGMAGLRLKGGFLLNLNYDLGLSNILPDVDGRSFKTRTFSISVGFVIDNRHSKQKSRSGASNKK